MPRAVELREFGEKSPLLPTRQGTGAGSLHDAQREQERRQRQALLGGSESLARGTTRLEQGQRMLLETENIGNDVLVSLQRQRQQIKGAQDTLEDTGGDLGASDKTLRNMYLQSLVNGSVWYLVVAVVVASLLLVLYAKLRSLGVIDKPHSPPPPPPLPLPPPPRALLLARATATGVAKPAAAL